MGFDAFHAGTSKGSFISDAKADYGPALKRKMAVSQTYNISDLKQKSKRYGVTLNTYLNGVILKALYDYTDGKEPMPILFCLPASTREPLNSPEDFTVDN